MTKKELEKAIENDESVWLATEYGIKELKKLKLKDGLLLYYNEDYKFNHTVEENYFNYLYKTKAEAEHYLHHANVTRVDKLPFLTWKEFKENKTFEFANNEGVVYELCIGEEKLQDKILLYEGVMLFYTWDLTEENFYEAYDECVRLFRGGE